MTWTTDSSRDWTAISDVDVGDPTEASHANYATENGNFLKETRAGLVRGYNVDDTEGSAQSAARVAGNNSGFVFNVHGVLQHDTYRPLLDKSEMTPGFPSDMDMRYRMIYFAGEFTGTFNDKATAQTYLPGGTHDAWFQESLSNGAGGLSLLSTYTSIGAADAAGGFGADHVATLGVLDAGLIIFAGSSAIGANPVADGCATGDLIIYNDYNGANEWIAYHLLICVGPAWGAV